MKGKVYFIDSTKQADNYNRVTEAILEYFVRNYTYGVDIVESLEELTLKDMRKFRPKKEKPPDDADEEEKEAIEDDYKEDMKHYGQRKRTFSTNLEAAYGVIWGQCTLALKNRIQQRVDWNKGDDKIKFNPINLLKAIKEITHSYQDNQYPHKSIFWSIKNAFNIQQEPKESLVEFTRRFNNVIDIMETQHGPLAMTAYM